MTAGERLARVGQPYIRFVVPGRPQPKQRPRVSGRSAYTPKETKAYEQQVGWAAKVALLERRLRPLTIGLVVDIVAGGVGAYDLDNVVKAVLDGMKGVVYEDDRQVVGLAAWRDRLGAKRVEVTVYLEPLPEVPDA